MPWSIRPNFEVVRAVQHLGTNIGSLGPREEHTESVNVPLMTGTGVSHNSRILAFEGNPVSCVQACGNGNMSPALAG